MVSMNLLHKILITGVAFSLNLTDLEDFDCSRKGLHKHPNDRWRLDGRYVLCGMERRYSCKCPDGTYFEEHESDPEKSQCVWNSGANLET